MPPEVRAVRLEALAWGTTFFAKGVFMELLGSLLVLGILGTVFVGSILGIFAFSRISSLRTEMKLLAARLRALDYRLFGMEEKSRGKEPLADSTSRPSESATAEKPEPIPSIPRTKKDIVRAIHASAGAKETVLPPVPRPVEAPERAEEAPWWAHLEEKAGKLWMTWAGAMALILAVGFFAKYAFDQGWLRPAARVIVGGIFGVVLVAAGERFMRRAMRPLGRGLIGAGLAILYISLYAASVRYDLIGRTEAFLLMAVVTAGGMGIAVVRDSLSVSILALLGGMLTPVILETGFDQRDALFTYVILLDLGALGVAFFRKWRSLDVLAFAGTWILFWRWFDAFYGSSVMTQATLWAAAFYVVFLVLPFVNHFRRRTPVTIERFLMALANAGVFFAFAWDILHAEHEHVLGFIVLGMSVCYLAGALLTRRMLEEDARALFGFVALSVTFFTISAPLHFQVHGITLFWAAEAPLLVCLGLRYRYLGARIGGMLVLLLAVMRLFGVHWPLHDGLFAIFFNRAFGTAICVPVSAFALCAVHQKWKEAAVTVDRVLKVAGGLMGGLILLVVLHAEVGGRLGFVDGRLARMAVVALWTAGALVFVLFGVKLCSLAARVAGLGALIVAVVIAIGFYLLLPGEVLPLFVNLRFAGGMIAAAGVYLYGVVLCRRKETESEQERRTGRFLSAAGVVAAAVFFSCETYQYCLRSMGDMHEAALTGRMCLTLIWALAGLVLLGEGVRLGALGVRVAGIVAEFAACTLALTLYAQQGFDGSQIILVNARFGSVMVAALAVFAYAFVLWARRHKGHPDEAVAGKILCALGTVVLFLTLSLESFQYFSHTITDAARARWMAQAALTVLWGAYATAMLSAGFWKRIKAFRIAALGLFGVAAAKLLIVDIAGIKQVWRIVAFLVMGLLMIGAAYLYHRLEKLLDAPSSESDEEAPGGQSP